MRMLMDTHAFLWFIEGDNNLSDSARSIGDSLDVFLDHFPSVSKEQAIASLELAKEMLTAYANPT